MANVDIKAKKCTTPVFRASYPHLFKPNTSFEGQEPKFGITMLFPKNADLSGMKKAAQNALIEKWGSDKTKWPKKLRNPFRDGDAEKDSEEYKGVWFISATSKKQPGVVNQQLEPIISESTDSDGFYAGCFARATLIAFAYDTAGNKGVSFALQNVQKVKDGKPFSGRKSASEDFEVIEDTSEDAENYGGSDESPESGESDESDMGF